MKPFVPTVLACLLVGCATADPPPQIAKDGCTVDPKKVCQYMVDQPNFHLYGARPLAPLDYSPMQHVIVNIPFHGSGALLRCKFHTRDSHAPRAIEANFQPGPMPDEANFKRMREAGLCR